MQIRNSKFHIEVRNIDTNLTSSFLVDLSPGVDNPHTLLSKLIRTLEEVLRKDTEYVQAELMPEVQIPHGLQNPIVETE